MTGKNSRSLIKTFDEADIMLQIKATVKACEEYNIELHAFAALMLPNIDSDDAIVIADGVSLIDEAISRSLELLNKLKMKHFDYHHQPEIYSDHDLFADVNHPNRFGTENLTDLIIADVFEDTNQSAGQFPRR